MPSTLCPLRQHILSTAWHRFATHGFDATSMADIATDAELELHEVFAQFPSKNDLVLELYRLLALQLEERVVELPTGTLARRFLAVIEWKIASLKPHRPVLEALFKTMLDSHQDLGVMSPHMELIRQRVKGVFASVVWGAQDKPKEAQIPSLVRHLYRLHLALVFLWFRNPAAYRRALRIIGTLLRLSKPTLDFIPLQAIFERVDELLHDKLEPYDQEHNLAEQILRCLFRHRRLQNQEQCGDYPCQQCFALHRERVEHFIQQGQPIVMVLPAFPAKSPNRSKVLGDLPDTAEELALRCLHNVCTEIKEIYPPGAEIIICSDGHVFSDLVGVTDEQVHRYQQALQSRIQQMNFDTLTCFDLQDIYTSTDYATIRQKLLGHYSEPLDLIRERVKDHAVHRYLFNGLHRFLFEDQAVLHPQRSRNEVRRQCKELTYEVIQRSNAWGRLVTSQFPEALRLSIHPQSPHSAKIGISLGPSTDNWITPWHGVAVLREQDYILMKRQQAEQLGAQLVYDGQQPVHFIIS